MVFESTFSANPFCSQAPIIKATVVDTGLPCMCVNPRSWPLGRLPGTGAVTPADMIFACTC